MSCVIYKGIDGSERRVPSGQAHVIALGEVFVGVDLDCASTPNDVKRKAGIEIRKQTETLKSLFQEIDDELGKGGGDWIKRLVSPVAKLLGKKNCSMCEARRVTINAYAQLKTKYGQVEALRVIKGLWDLSFKSDEKAVILKLKEYLK